MRSPFTPEFAFVEGTTSRVGKWSKLHREQSWDFPNRRHELPKHAFPESIGLQSFFGPPPVFVDTSAKSVICHHGSLQNFMRFLLRLGIVRRFAASVRTSSDPVDPTPCRQYGSSKRQPAMITLESVRAFRSRINSVKSPIGQRNH